MNSGTIGRKSRRRNPHSGVTMLELLISLAVMSAIALMLLSVLGLSGRALERVNPNRQDTDHLLSRLTLRTWLEAMPGTGHVTGTDRMFTFDTFLDEPPFLATDPARITVMEDDEGRLVVVSSLPGDAGEVRRAVLSQEGGETRITYFGSQGFGPPRWHPEWALTSGTPDLIRIDYGSGAESYPPLVVIPAFEARQSEISLSSPLPPG